MEVHYTYTGCPYSTAGSFMEYFEGLTYEHVNFIFSGDSHAQVLSIKYQHKGFLQLSIDGDSFNESLHALNGNQAQNILMCSMNQ